VSQALPPSVSIGIHVPSSAVAPLDSGDAYTEFFRQVEALGLDAVWTEDRIFHEANMLDPLMLLASAAACTRRIELGTAVLVVTLPPRPSSLARCRRSTISRAGGWRWAYRSAAGPRNIWRSACR
jgi:alkanesulfonate monooxygenase SsuD/methylene tetrahydromethanopterin reductase-like flavin-dependent oxidoreductase (luciferase family)